MQVYVNKNGQQYGPFTVEQLRQYVQQGNFTTADHACCDGQNWITIDQVPGFAAEVPTNPAKTTSKVRKGRPATVSSSKRKPLAASQGPLMAKISKDGKQFGPFTVEQLRQHVQQGNFTTADHACYDGENWIPLGQLPGLLGDTPDTPLPPALPTVPSKWETGCSIVALLALIGFTLWLINFCSSCETGSGSPKAGHDKLAAWAITKQFVEKRLKSPSSADWGWQSYNKCVSHLGNGRYQVKAWVDSQNSFGAKVRTHFVAIVSWRSGDSWMLESLNI
jgi:hypothetical protein